MGRRPPNSSERRREWSRKQSTASTATGNKGMCDRDRVNVPERGQTVQDAGDLFGRRFALSIVWLFQETAKRRPLLSDQFWASGCPLAATIPGLFVIRMLLVGSGIWKLYSIPQVYVLFSSFGYNQGSWEMLSGFLKVSLASALVELHPLSSELGNNLTVPLTSVLVGALLFRSGIGNAPWPR